MPSTERHETVKGPTPTGPAIGSPGWYPNPLGGKRYWNGAEWAGSRPSLASPVGLFLGGVLLLGYPAIAVFGVVTSDECEGDGGNLVCVSNGLETTMSIPLVVVLGLVGLVLVGVAATASRRWYRASQQAVRGGREPVAPTVTGLSPPPVSGAAVVPPVVPASPRPSTPRAHTRAPSAEEETIPGLEQFIRSSIADGVADPHTMEWQRARAVVAIDRIGGDEAVAALIRLLEVDTEHQPRLSAGQATMQHEVIARLGASGATDAVEPLLAAFGRHRQTANEDLCRTVVQALGELGDRRALPVLTAVVDDKQCSRGLRKAATRVLAQLGGEQS
jgi:hypothetical protein